MYSLTEVVSNWKYEDTGVEKYVAKLCLGIASDVLLGEQPDFVNTQRR